nr:zinc finger protein isoform X1 [Ciona intestinalis]|eukprot:XP_026693233.1 zinc finger protein isoform X1 [Ciona intestinalis]
MLADLNRARDKEMAELSVRKRHRDQPRNGVCRRRLTHRMNDTPNYPTNPLPPSTSNQTPDNTSPLTPTANSYVTPSYVTNTSSNVTEATPACLEPLDLCKDGQQQPSSPLLPLLRDKLDVSSTASDDEMNVDSPDSGFESATPSGISNSDFFDESSKSDDFSRAPKTPVSRTSSLDCDIIEDTRLCLTPPPKPEVKPKPQAERIVHRCAWDACSSVFITSRDLHDHICSVHVDTTTKRFCCLWSGCKVYNTPARSVEWLKQHVGRHTGTKRFRCLLDGCDASFNSQNGLARHVPSHFSDVNLPKARVPGYERKVLVKRRKIKDKKKALANIHDYLDQYTSEVMVSQLVTMLRHPVTSLPTHTNDSVTSQDNKEAQVICKRTSGNEVWHLTTNQTWVRTGMVKQPTLYFATPSPHRRKYKAVVADVRSNN